MSLKDKFYKIASLLFKVGRSQQIELDAILWVAASTGNADEIRRVLSKGANGNSFLEHLLAHSPF